MTLTDLLLFVYIASVNNHSTRTPVVMAQPTRNGNDDAVHASLHPSEEAGVYPGFYGTQTIAVRRPLHVVRGYSVTEGSAVTAG